MTDRLRRILELVAENPEEPLPRFMAGNELLNAGDPAAAAAQLTRYVEMLPEGDVGAAYRLLGRAHVTMGDAAAARQAFSAGIRAALAHGHADLADAIREEMGG